MCEFYQNFAAFGGVLFSHNNGFIEISNSNFYQNYALTNKIAYFMDTIYL